MSKKILEIRSITEYNDIGRLLDAIDQIALNTPSWLWDWSPLPDLADYLNRAQLNFERLQDDE